MNMDLSSIQSILSKFGLEADDRLPLLLQRFGAADSNAERVEIAYKVLEESSHFPELVEDKKSDEMSESIRCYGNEMFRIKKIADAVELYTNSACLAESKPVLALAYANRSAALLELGLIGECLRDIERALANGYPENLKEKLIVRKNKAINAMETYTPIQYHCPIPQIPSEHQNKLIECASDAVELKTSPDQGRHVVATRKIEIGQVIAVEKSFTHILTNHILTHCHCCLELCYDLVPCENCTQALYCGETCKKQAYKYHQYECQIMLTVSQLDTINKSTLLALRMTLTIKELYNVIENDSLQIDKDDIYRSNRYYEISKLVSHTEKRSVEDLLKKAFLAALCFRLVEKGTNFFDDGTSKAIFKEKLMFHLQACSINTFGMYEVTPDELLMNIYNDDTIGSGVYSFMSMFNHSCNPNVDRIFYGSVLVVRAVATINKGEQCCVSYGDMYSMVPRETRRCELKQSFLFECSCEPCEKDWPMWYNLPNATGEVIPRSHLHNLQVGDTYMAKKIWHEIAAKMKQIEHLQPEVTCCKYQTALKQCFSLTGNIRRRL